MLAILAGVGSVAYRGYIKKANEAADLELLSAVNTAFQSAYTEEGQYAPPHDALASLMNKKVSAVRMSPEDAENIDISDSFKKYFKGNEDKPFRVYEGLLYVKDSGTFAGSIDGGNTIIFDGGNKLTRGKTDADGKTSWTWEKDGNEYTFTTDQQGVLDFINSNFGAMQVGDLMGEVDNVVTAVNGLIPYNENLHLSKSFVDLEALGVTRENYPNNDDYNRAVANAIVLGVARNTEKLDFEKIGNNLKQGKLELDYKFDAFSQLAFPYAMVTGFVNSEAGKNAMVTVGGKQMSASEYYQQASSGLKDVTTGTEGIKTCNEMIKNLASSSEFQTYYDQNWDSDLAAYRGAMKTINENDQVLRDAGVLNSGFADNDFVDVLNALYGGA